MARILLIDDDLVLTRLVRLVLSTAGHTVEVAANGLEGLESLEGFAPEVILLDLNMPRMNGASFYTAARSRGVLVPVIVFSAYEAEREAHRLGAQAFIAKPFDPDRLLEVIDRLLPSKGDQVCSRSS